LVIFQIYPGTGLGGSTKGIGTLSPAPLAASCYTSGVIYYPKPLF